MSRSKCFIIGTQPTEKTEYLRVTQILKENRDNCSILFALNGVSYMDPCCGSQVLWELSTLTNISNHDGTSSLRHSASTPNQKLFCNVRIVVFRWFWKETVQSRSRWINVWGIDKRMQNKDSPYDFSKVLVIWHACTPTKVDKTWEPENWVFMLFNRAFVSGSATNQPPADRSEKFILSMKFQRSTDRSCLDQ